MIADVNQYKERYLSWLRDEMTVREVNGWAEVSTPFLDRHNDFTQIYIKLCGDDFLLSDDGYTVNDLEMCGCNLDSPKNQALLQTTLRCFGIKLVKDTKELTTKASYDNFAIRTHNLIQAMLAVNDLHYLLSPENVDCFFDDIQRWLRACDVRHISRLTFKGITGFIHKFDFMIPASLQQPERVLLSINNPDRASAERTVFAWEDTKETRRGDSRAYAILNDTLATLSPSVLDAFRNYDVRPVPWSERESVREELAA